MTGALLRRGGTFDFVRDGRFNISTRLAEGGRGMELSELVEFGDTLYAFDDRTGVGYAVDVGARTAVPRVVLTEGDGTVGKGMKAEWAAVAGGTLWVGSIGKPYTTPQGGFLHNRTLWVKAVGPGGVVAADWSRVYEGVLGALGIAAPGYAIHEAVTYAPVRGAWVFAPRKCSGEAYDDVLDERRGCGAFVVTRDLVSFRAVADPQHNATRGFSSIKAVPHDDGTLVYLKTVEVGDTTETYIGAVTIDGRVVMREQLVDTDKYEGLEFLPLDAPTRG